jgi:predicted transcriptional regulator
MMKAVPIRLDVGVKRRLDALASRPKRSKSYLAAEAVAAHVEAEEWQLGEIQQGLDDLSRGHTVSHEKAAKWIRG